MVDVQTPAAGWYPDSQEPGGQLRYWDGVAWTSHTAPVGAQPVVAMGLDYPVPGRGAGKATASLVLGIIGMVAWFIPFFGLPITVTGLALGAGATKSSRRGVAVAGIVLCSIGLVLTIGNAAAGAYLAATGQHPLVEWLLN